MPIVEANGVKLHVQQLGNDGQSIVMVHGLLLGSLPTWMFGVAPRLARKRQVTLYDLRGHGASERTASSYSLDSMASDLEYVVRHVAGGTRVLAGYSFGGAVVLRYATLHPGELDALIVVEAPLPVYSERWVSSLLMESHEEVLQRLTSEQRDALQRNNGRESRLMRQARELLTETSMMDDLQGQSDISDDELAAIDCPVLLVYGESSKELTDVRDRLLRVLPDARLATIAGGHYLPLDAPQELADLCEAFLDA